MKCIGISSHPLLIPAQGNHHVQLPSSYYSGRIKKEKKNKSKIKTKTKQNEVQRTKIPTNKVK